jgi:hypothetical protein
VNINKYLKNETIAESAGIVQIFTIIQRVLQTGRRGFFARILGPANFGVYAMLLLIGHVSSLVYNSTEYGTITCVRFRAFFSSTRLLSR